MTNCYSVFSVESPGLTPEEAAWIEHDLAPVDTWDLDEAETAVLRERTGLPDLDGAWPLFGWEIQSHPQGQELWLYAEEQFNADHVVSFVRRFIERWRPDYVFQMTWADTCNRPFVDAFGGGWLVITKDQVLSGTTGQAVQEALNRLGGAYRTPHQYLVVETDAGHIATPQVFDTRAQLDEYLEQWAVEAGYEGYADYQDSDHPERDLDWFELTVRAGELGPDVIVSIT